MSTSEIPTIDGVILTLHANNSLSLWNAKDHQEIASVILPYLDVIVDSQPFSLTKNAFSLCSIAGNLKQLIICASDRPSFLVVPLPEKVVHNPLFPQTRFTSYNSSDSHDLFPLRDDLLSLKGIRDQVSSFSSIENGALQVDLPFNQTNGRILSEYYSKTLQSQHIIPRQHRSCQDLATITNPYPPTRIYPPPIVQIQFIPPPPSFFTPPRLSTHKTVPTDPFTQTSAKGSLSMEPNSHFMCALTGDGILHFICLPLLLDLYILSLPSLLITSFALVNPNEQKKQPTLIDNSTQLLLDCLHIGTGKRERITIMLLSWMEKQETSSKNRIHQTPDQLFPSDPAYSNYSHFTRNASSFTFLSSTHKGCTWLNGDRKPLFEKGKTGLRETCSLHEGDNCWWKNGWEQHADQKSREHTTNKGQVRTHPTDLIRDCLFTQLSRNEDELPQPVTLNENELLQNVSLNSTEVVHLHFLLVSSSHSFTKTEEKTGEMRRRRASLKSKPNKTDVIELLREDITEKLAQDEFWYTNLYPFHTDPNIKPFFRSIIPQSILDSFPPSIEHPTHDSDILSSSFLSFSFLQSAIDMSINPFFFPR
ncbi:hypothetical protein BLNAU_22922 [Blattamonas nauphoetae]|uniref:Uncharacterized protein n=1 Tax=Blattamonas nauphoetae TaxID=2049346 RepID=A0ABQ9WRR4_9EUKA|nr:hypothetical protein BLNAU_22922 [Blattamonas nauphoetae]